MWATFRTHYWLSQFWTFLKRCFLANTASSSLMWSTSVRNWTTLVYSSHLVSFTLTAVTTVDAYLLWLNNKLLLQRELQLLDWGSISLEHFNHGIFQTLKCIKSGSSIKPFSIELDNHRKMELKTDKLATGGCAFSFKRHITFARTAIQVYMFELKCSSFTLHLIVKASTVWSLYFKLVFVDPTQWYWLSSK